MNSTLAAVLSLAAAAHATTERPIIAIATHPSASTNGDCGGDCELVEASYVKWIEAAGARAVPLGYSWTDAQVDALLGQVNGVLFPGGGSTYPPSAARAVNVSLTLAEAGETLPVWGTCLGFEWINQIIGGITLTGSYDSENYSIPLDFVDADAAVGSRMLGGLDSEVGSSDGICGGTSGSPFVSQRSATVPYRRARFAQVRDALGAENITMNNHGYGVAPATFAASAALSGFFDVLSTNLDRKGKEFVSTIEASDDKYAVFGTQWHPEKCQFEWGLSPDGTPYEAHSHSPHAVAASQHLANVSERA